MKRSNTNLEARHATQYLNHHGRLPCGLSTKALALINRWIFGRGTRESIPGLWAKVYSVKGGV